LVFPGVLLSYPIEETLRSRAKVTGSTQLKGLFFDENAECRVFGAFSVPSFPAV